LSGDGHGDWLPARSGRDPPAPAAVHRHPRRDDHLARPDAGDQRRRADRRFRSGYRWWGRGELLGISIPIWIFAIVALGGYLALHKTRWGRFVYAIGGNPEAARLAGVNVKRVLVSVYVLIGCLAGLAGFILSARLGSAEAVAGISFELRVIASVVIGGTSLMGGYGRIGGTIIGSIIMGILINGLVLMNVSAYYQQIITGLIIVLAVAFDTYAKSRRGAL
jgi:inositol transport system permease protein